MSNPNNLITSFGDVQIPGVSQTPSQGNKQQDKTPSQFWLNVGVMRNEKLVSLPAGIPLDKLQPKKIPSKETKNQDFRNLRIAEAQLWAKFQQIMLTLKPGERKQLQLDVEIYRIKPEEQVVIEESNPYASDDFSLEPVSED